MVNKSSVAVVGGCLAREALLVTGALGSGDRAGPGISGYGPRVWLALALVAVLAVAIGWSAPARAGYASIIVNAETGEVLHAVNADDRHYPASLTKVMTLYLVFDALRDKRLTMDTEVPISAHAARQPASHLGLQAGDRIKVRDAILALIIKSANDVAAALGEKLGGSERKFSYLMNAKARELGMSHTTFRNASGLPNRQQFTTARDFARLVQALQKNYPGYYKLFSTRSFTWRGKTIDTHNRLLDRYEGADGVKTGYIRASGFNLAASARRAGLRLIGVVMGARSPRARDLHMMGLLERGFEKATDGRYIAYDYDRNLRIDSSHAGNPPRSHVERARGAHGAVRLARLTPPRRPAELVRTTAEGSAPDPEIPVAPERKVLNWEIQVGAFSRFAPAHLSATRAMRRLPSLLAHTHVNIVPSRENGSTVYRARLRGLDSDQADRACELLKAKSIPCLTVPPPDAPAATVTR